MSRACSPTVATREVHPYPWPSARTRGPIFSLWPANASWRQQRIAAFVCMANGGSKPPAKTYKKPCARGLLALPQPQPLHTHPLAAPPSAHPPARGQNANLPPCAHISEAADHDSHHRGRTSPPPDRRREHPPRAAALARQRPRRRAQPQRAPREPRVDEAGKPTQPRAVAWALTAPPQWTTHPPAAPAPPNDGRTPLGPAAHNA